MIINFTVNMLEGEENCYEINIDDELTVRDLKNQIAEKSGMSPDRIFIMFTDDVLQDNAKLKDYNLSGRELCIFESPEMPGANPSDESESEPEPEEPIHPYPHRLMDGTFIEPTEMPMSETNPQFRIRVYVLPDNGDGNGAGCVTIQVYSVVQL